MKNKKLNTKVNIYLILNFSLAILTMVFVLLFTGRMLAAEGNTSPLFLGLAILSELAFQVLSFIVKKGLKDRLRVALVSLIIVGSAIVAFMAEKNYKLFYISTFLFVLSLAVDRLLLIGKGTSKSDIFINIMLGLVLIGIGVAVLGEIKEEYAHYIPLVTAVLLLFDSLKRLVFPSFKIEKIRLLIDILLKTHTLDVLICLLAFIIAFSFIFPIVEPNITNFWDAMWYCFAVITTIGFGDFAAATLVGRILTVILGIYGIVVVAILTSVIVNFYNEVTAKEKRNIEE